MAVAILKNGREGECLLFMLGFCSDDLLEDRDYPGDPNFLEVVFPATSPGADAACTSFQQLVSDGNCFVSINGLTAGDCLLLPAAGGGTVCVPMDDVGGVAVEVASADPVFTTVVGVAIDVTLCNGNGYQTKGLSNEDISISGPVMLYHELIGHALHICNGTFNAADPEEGQAIPEENVLRGILGQPLRGSHDGGCGGGTNCIMATAAYGSAIAPEVQELRLFRDRILRRTDWGTQFFDDFHKYYYQFSPSVARLMAADPYAKELLRAALVAPLMTALRLFVNHPADPDDPEQAVRFTRRATEEFATWLRHLPLANSAQKAGTGALTGELMAAFSVLRSTALREALVDNLEAAGLLPLSTDSQTAAKLRRDSAALGLAPAAIERLLGREEGGS